jgi:hypothetical protein
MADLSTQKKWQGYELCRITTVPVLACKYTAFPSWAAGLVFLFFFYEASLSFSVHFKKFTKKVRY